MLKLASNLSKLALTPNVKAMSFHTTQQIFFHLTDTNLSAMTKKKKKMDPQYLKAKDERRRKRLAKALRKMEKKERQPKPLIECEVPLTLLKEAVERQRGIVSSEEVKEERIYLQKEWSRFAYIRHRNELWKQDRILLSQQIALDELKKESEDLYKSAIEFDPDILPIVFKGPVATPPIEGYLQDGEYKDCTPTYKVIYEDTEEFLKTLLMRKRKRRAAVEEDD